MNKIGFIGIGKMATALISAFIREGAARPEDIICSDVSTEQLRAAGDSLGIRVAKSNREVIETSDLFVLAFKPQNFAEATADLGNIVRSDQVIISILAGVRIANIEQALPGRVVRVMPNAACLVGQMAAGFAAAPAVTETDLTRVKQLLECAGLAVGVTEELMDAVTGVSGSGLAFVAHLIAAYIEGGTKAGLSHDAASTLTLKTFEGTVRLLTEQNLSPDELIKMVSSPNGTTVAGREILESSDVADVIGRTILRATERSVELGK
jgi:pyrroline-5-carboxylate reductase